MFAAAWIDALAALGARGEASVVVTVASVRGSAPREVGARMLVTPHAIEGTIGGGNLELGCIEQARAMLALAEADPVQLVRHPLGPALQQCCGGAVTILFERISASLPPAWLAALGSAVEQGKHVVLVTGAEGLCRGKKLVVGDRSAVGSLGSKEADAAALRAARDLLAAPAPTTEPALRALTGSHPADVALVEPIAPPGMRIALFGAGHVGQALVRVLAGVDCRITWVDTRADQFPPVVPAHVRPVLAVAPEIEIDRAPAGAFCVVMTHSHALDFELVERALRRDDLAYVGMIGSIPKRNRFLKYLKQEGVPGASLDRLRCPIGIAGIAGKEPATIAIAVAAELLQARDAAAAAWGRAQGPAARERRRRARERERDSPLPAA